MAKERATFNPDINGDSHHITPGHREAVRPTSLSSTNLALKPVIEQAADTVPIQMEVEDAPITIFETTSPLYEETRLHEEKIRTSFDEIVETMMLAATDSVLEAPMPGLTSTDPARVHGKSNLAHDLIGSHLDGEVSCLELLTPPIEDQRAPLCVSRRLEGYY